MVTAAKPRIAITMGDPCGIGPEVVAKALASEEIHNACLPVVIGNSWVMEQAVRLAKVNLQVREVQTVNGVGELSAVIDVLDTHNLNPEDIVIGKVVPACGKAAMEWVAKAAELAVSGEIDAICTAPINKEAARLANYKTIGHMELLQQVSHAPQVATMLMSGRLKVVHLTTHRSLRAACEYVNKERILASLELTHREFGSWGMPNPLIGVAALNPHASDGGLLGQEEKLEIAPAIEEARRNGINARGPVPADIVFSHAIEGRYDVVLAMYHDQGHIPVKVYGFERSISVNLGLPFIRTSVDHGTAFDIVGKGVANHRSMMEAIRVAISLSKGEGLT